MNARRWLRIAGTVVLLVLVGYFYAEQVIINWASIHDFKLGIKAHFLLLALVLDLISFLLEAYAWHLCVRKHAAPRRLVLAQSIAVVRGSGVLKYLPGRIWTYTAQMVWLRKYGISKAVILYVNLICILGSITASLYLGLVYLAMYSNIMDPTAVAIAIAAAVLLNLVYIKWNAPVINWLIAFIARYLKREIAPLKESAGLIALIQLLYMCSAAISGVGAYLLANGIGLTVAPSAIFAILASLSLSWLVGYLAVTVPGGLGVREGVMLSMLHSIVDARTAVILPIVTRLLAMLAELILGAFALWIGMKYKVFTAVGLEEGQ